MSVIYIASPYSVGDVAANVSTQIDAAHRIMDMGHAPIAPLLSHYLHIYRQRPYEEWLKSDLEIIRKVDVVLRLPGASKGADQETGLAEELDIPVAHGWDQLGWILEAKDKETQKPEPTDITLDGGVVVAQENISDAMYHAMLLISAIGTTACNDSYPDAKKWMETYFPNWAS